MGYIFKTMEEHWDCFEQGNNDKSTLWEYYCGNGRQDRLGGQESGGKNQVVKA